MVLSFGELLLRIIPDGAGEWLQKNTLPFHLGGTELNVATALAQWDVPSSYMSAMPDNFLTKQILNYLNEKRVDISRMIFQGERLGLYFLPEGTDLKHPEVIYDRAGSAFASLSAGDIDWDKVFDGISWFHTSAICPALNENIATLCLQGMKAASQKGIFVSLDLNYRSKLWKYGTQPSEVMPELAQHADLIMGNLWAAEKMLNIPLNNALLQHGDKESYTEHARQSSELILKEFYKCNKVAFTFRFDAQHALKYFATLHSQESNLCSQEYSAANWIDKVGTGDCFMAGLIYGILRGNTEQQTLEFATAAAFNKFFERGDATSSKVSDILKIIKTHAG